MNYAFKEIMNRWVAPAASIVIWTTVIGGCSALMCREDARLQEGNKLAEQVLQIAAGEDRVLDKAEKSALLNELRIPGIIDESQRIYFHYGSGDRIIVGATAGYRDYNSLGTTTKSNLLEYIARHKMEAGK